MSQKGIRLAEIADSSGITVDDLLEAALTGKIEICVRPIGPVSPPLPAEAGNFNGKFRALKTNLARPLPPLYVDRYTINRLFADPSAEIPRSEVELFAIPQNTPSVYREYLRRERESDETGEEPDLTVLEPRFDQAGGAVTRESLVVLSEEQERFQREYLRSAQTNWAGSCRSEQHGEDDNASPSASHSEDFTSVNWYGDEYTFKKGNQAECVRILWEAWENGTPVLNQETIAEKIGSADDHFELRKTFRTRRKSGGYEDHPAFGTMIQQAGKGQYRLSPPESG